MHISGAAGRIRHLGVRTFASEDLGIEATHFIQVGNAVVAAIRSGRAGSPRANAHNFGVLLVRTQDGESLPIKYTKAARVVADSSGRVSQVTVDLPPSRRRQELRAYLMVDTTPVATDVLDLAPTPR